MTRSPSKAGAPYSTLRGGFTYTRLPSQEILPEGCSRVLEGNESRPPCRHRGNASQPAARGIWPVSAAHRIVDLVSVCRNAPTVSRLQQRALHRRTRAVSFEASCEALRGPSAGPAQAGIGPLRGRHREPFGRWPPANVARTWAKRRATSANLRPPVDLLPGRRRRWPIARCLEWPAQEFPTQFQEPYERPTDRHL